MEVDGVGVLLLGASGIGKSECAIALVKWGHRLVADDIVLIERRDDDLVGSAPDLVRHYVELRGIGIVHVPSLFGPQSVQDEAKLELVVCLEAWGSGEVERVGLEEQRHPVAGCELACVHLPVAPGRNLAALVEVAARKHKLESTGGRRGARDLDERVSASLRTPGR